MKKYIYFTRMLLLTTLVIAGTYIQRSHAQGSTFNYQGVLSAAGIVANGSFDLQFRLYDDPAGGSQIGTTVLREDVLVKNGLFTVPLDFGLPAFSGALRYLEVGVRVGASTGGFSLLTPREPINPTPYAMTSVNFSGSLAGDVVGGQGGTRVVAIQGRPISANSPGNGQVLAYNAATNRYEPVSAAAGGGGAAWEYVTTSAMQLEPNRRYAIDGQTRVVLTLPASPNVGDVVEIQSLGPNGWSLVRGAAGQYIYGYEQTPIPIHPDRNWAAVASSADGLRLVAAVRGGQIYTSTDGGLNWTARESNRDWTSVASSADGLRLAACVSPGKIHTSSDGGVTWTARGEERFWQSVASSADGLKLAAAGFVQDDMGFYSKRTMLYTSVDGGLNWAIRDAATRFDSITGNAYITSSANGMILIHLQELLGLSFAARSTDSGATWNSITGFPRLNTNNCVAMSADGSRIVVSGNPFVQTSSDEGETWLTCNVIGGIVASSADGLRLSVAGNSQIYTTMDGGVTWTERKRIHRSLSAIASSADGLRLVVCEHKGQIQMSSDGGVSWHYPDPQPVIDTSPGIPLLCATGTYYSALKLIYTGGGRFHPLVSSGLIRYQDGC